MSRQQFNHIPYMNMKKIFIGIILLALVIVGFFFLYKWDDKQGEFPDHETEVPVIEHNGIEYVQRENVETFLVLGLDNLPPKSISDAYVNNNQADFLMLLVLDNEAKQYTAIHISHDTMTDINVLGLAGEKIDSICDRIAMAYTYGNGRNLSCHNTSDAVSSLLMGVEVDGYVALNAETVEVLNDLVGGVELVVLDDFTEIDPLMVKGESVTLTGTQAVTYIHGNAKSENNSNSNKTNRQKQYIRALYNTFVTKMTEEESGEQFASDVSQKMTDYIVSNKSSTRLQTIINKVIEYDFLGERDIEGKTLFVEDHVEFHPDKDKVKEMVLDLFYKPKN